MSKEEGLCIVESLHIPMVLGRINISSNSVEMFQHNSSALLAMGLHKRLQFALASLLTQIFSLLISAALSLHMHSVPLLFQVVVSGAVFCLPLLCFVLIEGRSTIQCRTYYSCHASEYPDAPKEVTFQFPHTSRIAAPRTVWLVSPYRGIDPRKEGILMLVLTLQFPSGLCESANQEIVGRNLGC